MKPTEVTYERLVNTGNYSHEKFSVKVNLESGDTVASAIEACRRIVAQRVKEHDWRISEALKVMANEDAHTGIQVKEARKILLDAGYFEEEKGLWTLRGEEEYWNY